MKKIFILVVVLELFSSCVSEYRARHSGIFAPRRRVCVVGRGHGQYD